MTWRRLARWSAALGLGALLGVFWVAWRGVDLYLHPPRHTSVPETLPAAYGVAYRDLILQATDGITLAAWYVPPRNGCVILQAHGYGGRRDALMTARLAQAGYGVLAWDFRAHGASGGSISTLGGAELHDAEAALAYVRAQPDVTCIAAWGESMGGVVLIRLAARHPDVVALVSDSAFPSLEEMLQHAIHPPLLRLPMRLLAELRTGIRFRDVRPVDEIVRVVPRPVLIIHGTADTVTPPGAAQQLCAAAGQACTLWLVPQAEHVAARATLPEVYYARVLDFLDAALLRP